MLETKTKLKNSVNKALFTKEGFTLIEILIVVTIIAILAATFVPSFIGFDAEARVTATQTNLESIRTRVNLFRAKEGKYPDSLGDLMTTFFSDVGVQKPYFKKLPAELVSDPKGNKAYVNQSSSKAVGGDGGWIYITDTAEVRVNFSGTLGKRWGDYADEEPSEW